MNDLHFADRSRGGHGTGKGLTKFDLFRATPTSSRKHSDW